MAWRVVDAVHALKRAVELGATEYSGPGKTLDVPAVIGIGGSLLHFVDTYRRKGSPHTAEFPPIGGTDPEPLGAGFYYLDPLTHTVCVRHMTNTYLSLSRKS